MNYKKIQTIVKHQFEWEKSFFFLTVFFMLVVKIVFMIFNLHTLLIAFGMAITFVPVFFIKPEFTGKEKGFSAKYLLGLPLTREELFFSQVIVNSLTFLPLILWLALFYNYAKSIIDFFDSASTVVFITFAFAILYGTKIQSTLYANARGSLTRMGSREAGFFFLKVYAYFILIGGGIGCFSYFLEREYGLKISLFFAKTLKYLDIAIHTKWLGLGLLAWALYNYFYAKMVSQDDKLSSRKPWNLKSDLIYLGASASFMGACLFLALNSIPQLIRGEMQVAVFHKDYKEIQKLISSGVDINKPNEYGMTPMMVALDSGDIKLVTFLEEKGANYNGEINKKDDKIYGFDTRSFAVVSNNVKLLDHIKDKVPSFNKSSALKTLYPIHVAAKYCNPKVIDYLIANGVNIEARTEHGNTPIVIAARNNCFESVVSLKEAGALFDVKDTKGKLALSDLGKKASPELKMFVEKNMRVPASK